MTSKYRALKLENIIINIFSEIDVNKLSKIQNIHLKNILICHLFVYYCEGSVPILKFYWVVFSRIWIEYGDTQIKSLYAGNV